MKFPHCYLVALITYIKNDFEIQKDSPDGHQFMDIQNQSWSITDEKDQNESHEDNCHVVFFLSPKNV